MLYAIKNYGILLFIMTIMASCPRKVKFTPPPDEVRVDTGVINRAPVQLDSSANARVSFKGLYTVGNEVSTFYDCSTQKTFWLTDSTGRLAKLYEAADRGLTYPYESVYVEVQGYLKGKSALGYASEYENELVVKDVFILRPKDFQTDCYPYEFIALGNEPFWALDIIPHEKRIVLKDVGNQKVYEFPYVEAETKQEETLYTVQSRNKKDKLTVLIQKQVCSDGMSDRQYNYSATITLNGTTLKGCAVRKGEKI